MRDHALIIKLMTHDPQNQPPLYCLIINSSKNNRMYNSHWAAAYCTVFQNGPIWSKSENLNNWAKNSDLVINSL